jgi:hypothetical protein
MCLVSVGRGSAHRSNSLLEILIREGAKKRGLRADP